MPDPAVIHADLELFLTRWYRAALAARPEDVCRGVEVDNREPGGEQFPERLLVIRNDGGPETSLLTGRRNVGLSVLAGDPENPQDAADLAEIVYALRTQIPSTDPDNPVAAVLGSLGPYRVPEFQPRARRYMTFSLSVVGKAL
ncbi:hypothetical protein [Microbacterium sp. CFBP 8794]|uniref:hypothetical protein n=1 Tax=Microbacterium sp. CFBP 8794 TaxID=2775269 RepID=UPI0017836A14|nr:hypothetical protein [Microbacterium sp. CFBP 8794]MBD8477568.1 hypothetical protein [Microbacterium sp. CFBP 8794]